MELVPEGIIIILHWNTDYAEIPRQELPNVVKSSYQTILSELEDFEGKICCNITGHTLEYLRKQYPELLDSLKSLVKTNIIELTLTGYSHPILPILPTWRIRDQLISHKKILTEIFNITPTGLWPPELGVSPTVISIAKEIGIEWVTVDQEHLELTQFYANDHNIFEKRVKTVTEILAHAFWSKGVIQTIRRYRKALKALTTHMQGLQSPLQTIEIQQNQTFKALTSSQSWWNASKIALSNSVSLFKTKHLLKAVKNSQTKYLPLYTSDIEFFGYREFGNKIPTPKSLFTFLKELQKLGSETITPTQIDNSDWNNKTSFIGTGSWSSDKSYRIWTESEDNKEFTRRLNEIYRTLEKNQTNDHLPSDINRLLRIAENSDSRGWAPLPERKHEAYSAILELQKLLKIL